MAREERLCFNYAALLRRCLRKQGPMDRFGWLVLYLDPCFRRHPRRRGIVKQRKNPAAKATGFLIFCCVGRLT